MATFNNWVNKTANFFTDEVELEPGSLVSVKLPAHWQSTIALVAAWSAGLVVVLDGSNVEPDLQVVGPDARNSPEEYAGAQVLACSLRPLGGAFVEPLPDGWFDFGRDIAPQPDVRIIATAPAPRDSALAVLTGTVSHAELVEQAGETAGEVGLSAGGRLITDANPSRASGLTAGIVAPLIIGGSVVLAAHCDADARSKIAAQEQATSTFWLTG